MPGEPLAIAVQSGDFERVHYALVLASGAAALGRPVTLFLTGPAVVLSQPDGWRRLAGAERDADFVAAGVAGFETLWAACRELDVTVLACELALRIHGLPAPAEGIRSAGVVAYLHQPPGTAFLFV